MKVTENENSLKILFVQQKGNLFLRIFTLLFAIGAFVIPIHTVFFLYISLAVLILGFISFAVGYLALRHFLWNTYGRESILINDKSIVQIISYKYFEDKTNLINNNVKLLVHLEKRRRRRSNLDLDVLDNELGRYTAPGIFRFTKNRNVAIEINTIIPPAEIEELERLIKKHLNN